MKHFVLGAAAAATLFASATLAMAETTWTAYTYLASPNVAGSKAVQAIADEFEKQTNGDVKMQVSLAGALPIKAADITPSVSAGIIQLAGDGFFLGSIEEGGVLRLPLLFSDVEAFRRGVAAVTPYLEKAFDEKGVVLLAQYLYPQQVVWGAGEIRSLSDLAGKKVRVSSPEQGAFVSAFGGQPVTIGGAEVPTALQTGVVEAVFTAAVGGGRLWRDQLKSTYQLGPDFFNSAIIVNKAAFEALTPEQQDMLRKIATEKADIATRENLEGEAALTAEFEKAGLLVTQPSDADVDAAAAKMKPFWAEWAAGKEPSTQAALKAALAAIGQ